MENMRIGFIGIGAMGKGMAQNLINAGYRVCVFDKNAESCRSLVGEYTVAASIAEVCKNANTVISMLPSTPHLLEVALGQGGIADSLSPGASYIDMSTVSPQGTLKVGAALEKKGIRMMDAPVSGGVNGAKNGTLTIFIGGDEQMLEEMRPLLSCMGSTLLYMGGAGTGEATKLAHNICSATLVATFSEAVVFARKLGVQPDRLVEALSRGSCSGVLKTHVEQQGICHNFSQRGFPASYMLKDLGLAREAAEQEGLPLFFATLTGQLLTVLKAKGLGQNTYTEIIRVFEDIAGITDK